MWNPIRWWRLRKLDKLTFKMIEEAARIRAVTRIDIPRIDGMNLDADENHIGIMTPAGVVQVRKTGGERGAEWKVDPPMQPLTSAQVRAMFPDRTKPQVPTRTTSLRPARTGGYADAPRSYYDPSSNSLDSRDRVGYSNSGADVLTTVLVAEAIEHLEAPSSIPDDYSSSGSDSSNTDSFVGSGGDFGGGGSSGDY